MRGVRLGDAAGVLIVETGVGRDYVMSSLDSGALKTPSAAGEKQITAHFAVVSVQDGRIAWTFVQDN